MTTSSRAAQSGANTPIPSPETTPTFTTGDRVINRPGSWDRGQVPGTVRSTHTYDDGRVLVHVNHDDGCFTSWGANELERAGEAARPFKSEIVEDSSVPTPCIVTLPNGGYDLDHDADTGQRELYIHSPADARSVGEALLAAAAIHDEPGQVEESTEVDLSFGAVLPPELDSKISSEDQDRDAEYVEAVLERHRAAAETLTEREWAALGRRMLRDQLEPGAGVPIATSEHLADLSGTSVRRLWLGEES